MTYPWIMDDRFNAAFPHMAPPPSRGVTLNSAPPTGARVPVYGNEPVRLDPDAMQKWRTSTPVDQPIPSAVPPAPFPAGGAAPVVAAPAPVVQPGGPSGITLNNTAPASGWGGSIGLPSSPEQAQAFAGGQNYEKLMGGLDEIKKGFKRDSKSTDMNTITPMSGTSTPGGNQMGANILAQLIQNMRARY